MLETYNLSQERPKRRAIQDFYVTPAPVTEALLKVEKFPGIIWEPACGKGHISEVLKAHGYNVFSSDIKDRGYGDEVGVDFLDTVRDCDHVLTNPPYIDDLNIFFAAHALYVAKKKVALLLPLHFLETPKRRRFLRESPLRTVWIFEYRVHTLREGRKPASRMIFAWFVWQKGFRGKPQIDWLTQ